MGSANILTTTTKATSSGVAFFCLKNYFIFSVALFLGCGKLRREPGGPCGLEGFVLAFGLCFSLKPPRSQTQTYLTTMTPIIEIVSVKTAKDRLAAIETELDALTKKAQQQQEERWAAFQREFDTLTTHISV